MREDIEAVKAALSRASAAFERAERDLYLKLQDAEDEVERVHELLIQYTDAWIESSQIIQDAYLRSLEYRRADKEAAAIVEMLMDERHWNHR